MGEAAQTPRVSFEEYLAFIETAEGRHELVDGAIYAMTGGTLRHVLVAGNIHFALRTALRGRSCFVFAADAMVRPPTDDALYPDVVVTCAEKLTSPRWLVEPTVVVEVLSDSTSHYDRGLKFDKYRTIPTLQEYALVDPDHVYVDVYRRGTDGIWTLHPARQGDSVELKSLGVILALEDIYAGADALA
jgi:Uma2 family endonuclease